MARGHRCGGAMAITMLASALAVLLLSLPADANHNLTGNLLGLDLERSWGTLSVDFHAQSCPDVANIVSVAVFRALQADPSLASGLIRLYFNDCFTNGCDASILLTGPASEERFPANVFLNHKAMELIEAVRVQVHQQCGPTVSCADILALAAREAVHSVGGEDADMVVPLGRLDSTAPAIFRDYAIIPPPTTEQAGVILNAFAQRGYHKAQDVVALLGGHSVGRAHCESFNDRFWRAEPFAQELARQCRRDVFWAQPLDNTPNDLDTVYYNNLRNGRGVLTYENALMNHPETAAEVRFYSVNPQQFLRDFAVMMARLINVKGGTAQREIRRVGCSRTNSGSFTPTQQDGQAASA